LSAPSAAGPPEEDENRRIDSECEDVRRFLEIFLRTPRKHPQFRLAYAAEAVFSMSAGEAIMNAPGSPFPGQVRNLRSQGQPTEVWRGRDEILRRFSAFFGEIQFRPTLVAVPVPVQAGITAVVVVGGVENFSFVRTFTVKKDQGCFAILSDQIHFHA
jgi:hypothetical protein